MNEATILEVMSDLCLAFPQVFWSVYAKPECNTTVRFVGQVSPHTYMEIFAVPSTPTSKAYLTFGSSQESENPFDPCVVFCGVDVDISNPDLAPSLVAVKALRFWQAHEILVQLR